MRYSQNAAHCLYKPLRGLGPLVVLWLGLHAIQYGTLAALASQSHTRFLEAQEPGGPVGLDHRPQLVK
jgi:hypothetical protein